MDSVQRWTGRETRALRHALRMTVRGFAEHLGVAPRTVNKWEALGEGTTPRPDMQAALDTVLRRAQAEERQRFERQVHEGGGRSSGGSHPLSSPVVAAMPSFDPGTPVRLGVGAAEYVAPIRFHVRPPSQVGWTDVEKVRLLTRNLAGSENLFGGELPAVTAATELRWAAGLLDARGDEQVRVAMLEAVGNLAGVAAFSAFDVGSHESAARCFRFALWCAEQGGSWELRAATLADMARHAIYRGELDEALSLIEFAQVRSDRLTATGRASISVVRARLLALMGRFRDARDQVTMADAAFAERDPKVDPPWLTYYDEAEHAGSTARALIPAELDKGREGEAAQRLRSAVDLHRENYPRSRAFSGIRLATLSMSVGDPREAVRVAREALNAAASVSSRRIEHELHGLGKRCQRHMTIPEVADLARDLAVITTDA